MIWFIVVLGFVAFYLIGYLIGSADEAYHARQTMDKYRMREIQATQNESAIRAKVIERYGLDAARRLDDS